MYKNIALLIFMCIIKNENYFQFGGLMERNISYKTKQKSFILKSIQNQKHEFTVKDIYESLNGDVGLTTIYRLVDKLVSENKLNKYITKDNITYYEYLDECNHNNHFYLKCTKCGFLKHIDCDCINDMETHIYKEHRFSLNKDNIIINGVCENCIKEDKTC